MTDHCNDNDVWVVSETAQDGMMRVYRPHRELAAVIFVWDEFGNQGRIVEAAHMIRRRLNGSEERSVVDELMVWNAGQFVHEKGVRAMVFGPFYLNLCQQPRPRRDDAAMAERDAVVRLLAGQEASA